MQRSSKSHLLASNTMNIYWLQMNLHLVFSIHLSPIHPDKQNNTYYLQQQNQYFFQYFPNYELNRFIMHIEKDPYRYINWLLFTLAASINSIPTQAFSGVSPIITRVYQVSEFEANIPSFIFPTVYIFMLIPANYLLDKKGLKPGTLFCQICMIVGLLVRLLINVHIYLFFLGTFICSLGFCFMLSGANKFANLWFPHSQIFMVSSICVFAIFSSDAIGTLLGSVFIVQDSTKDDIFTFFLWQSVVMVVIHILMALFFRGKPRHLQNFASKVKRNPFKSDLQALLHNRNYRILFLCCTFIFGTVSIIYVFMPWITKAYSYDTVFNGYSILSANVAGCIGCIIISTLANNLSYKSKTIILASLETIALVLFWGTLELKSPGLTVASAGLFGLFCYPLLTTLTDFATQTTFPVGEATASGILLFGGQLAGVILSIIFSFIFDGESLNMTRVLNALIILFLILALVVAWFAEQILKRDDYQDEHAKRSLLGEHFTSQEEQSV